MKLNRIRLILVISLLEFLFCLRYYSAASSGQVQVKQDWQDYVRDCLDTLIDHGTDVYGSVKTPMLMAVIDVNTLTAPENPKMYDSYIRTEGRPTHGRRSPGGCNLWLDQPTLKVMYRFTKITGDSRYADAADAYIRYSLQHCVKPNGLFIWGSHIYYHAYKDRLEGDRQHEIPILLPDWHALYRINPDAVRKEVDGIWKYHILDPKTGAHNRHDIHGSLKADFTFTGSSYILAFAFMHSATGEKQYLDKAKLITDWHWQHRNKDTNLMAEAPLLKGNYGGNHCYTSISGPFASALLRSYELTGEKRFRDIAIEIIKVYDKYGWDSKARTYYGILTLDGKPVMKPFKTGYDAKFYPAGHIDLWRTIMYSYEFPLIAAQASLYAYELSADDNNQRDGDLLQVALHWAEVIENNLPPDTGRRWRKEIQETLPDVITTKGTYAENYGRAISFFAHLHQATKVQKYRQLAEGLAKEAVEKLYENGLFKGHPAKPYYETNDGVGLLLYALLELDAPAEKMRGAF